MLKTIKISEHNYEWLCSVAGKLQKEAGKRISIDQALQHLHKDTGIEQLAGAWKMTDAEEQEMWRELKRGWKQWDKKYA